ncbi:hypothetical protein Tco_0958444, partial [Tanacetum coccineum]
EVHNAVKEDPALNKKVLEAIEAYIKNLTTLAELLTLMKTFDFSSLKSLTESLKVIVDAQNDHFAKWAKSSTSMACTWKTFGGNTRDLGSILEETRQDCKLAQRRLEELLTEGGDDVKIPCDAVWIFKRWRRNSCDSVRS